MVRAVPLVSPAATGTAAESADAITMAAVDLFLVAECIFFSLDFEHAGQTTGPGDNKRARAGFGVKAGDCFKPV